MAIRMPIVRMSSVNEATAAGISRSIVSFFSGFRVLRLTRWKHRDKGALESTKQDRPDDNARAVHHGRDPAEDHDAGYDRCRNEEIERTVRVGKVLYPINLR